MKRIAAAGDCLWCGSAGSVQSGTCQICLTGGEPAIRAGKPLLHPSIPLRFADVVRELEEIVGAAGAEAEVGAERLAAACLRAQSLLRILRLQFLDDVVYARERPSERERVEGASAGEAHALVAG